MIIFFTFPAQGVAGTGCEPSVSKGRCSLVSQSSPFNLLWSQLSFLLYCQLIFGGALVEQGVDLIKTHKDPHLHSFITHQLCWPEGYFFTHSRLKVSVVGVVLLIW